MAAIKGLSSAPLPPPPDRAMTAAAVNAGTSKAPEIRPTLTHHDCASRRRHRLVKRYAPTNSQPSVTVKVEISQTTCSAASSGMGSIIGRRARMHHLLNPAPVSLARQRLLVNYLLEARQ